MSDQITVSKSELQAMINAAIAENKPATTAGLEPEQFATLIGTAVQQGMAKHQRPKVSYGEYIRRPHSSTHTDPKHPNGPTLTREVHVNGLRQDPAILTDSEINFYNRINRSGRFIDRLVEVRVDSDNVELRFNNKTVDQRNEIERKGDMLALIVAEQDTLNAEDVEVQEEKVERRRAFGQSKASRLAREAAGVS